MQIQKVFQAGNSDVVAIPKNLGKETGIKTGQKVFIEIAPDGEGIFIKKASKVTKKQAKSTASKEFDKWLKQVLKEDKKILDELAVR